VCKDGFLTKSYLEEKTMWHATKVYLALVPIFLVVDLTYLGLIMTGFYKSELGPLARRVGDSLTPVYWAAAAVYLLIPLGIVLFALPRVSSQNVLLSGLFWGFLYGVTLYGVYDMTNYSLIKDWPLRMSFADIAWGGVLCALMTYVAALLDGWVK
jgi:uncharacterized membrane protein